MTFDWMSILIGVAVASILFNITQVVSAYFKKKKAEEDLKKADAELRKIKREIESSSKALQNSLLKDLKGDEK